MATLSALLEAVAASAVAAVVVVVVVVVVARGQIHTILLLLRHLPPLLHGDQVRHWPYPKCAETPWLRLFPLATVVSIIALTARRDTPVVN